MTFNKKLIAGAVGASLSLGLSLQSAQAELLFPYVVKDTNRTTLVTITGSGTPVNSGSSLHIQYWTKSTTDANTAACSPNSSNLTFTDNDIVSFDTAALLGAGPLFGDTTNSAPLGTSISYAGPRHGYLVVSQTQTGGNGQLYDGFWLEVDLANGGAHGDRAFNNGSGVGAGGAFGIANVSIVLLEMPQSNPMNAAMHSSVTFWPTSIASTVFTVTPLGNDMETNDNHQSTLQVYNTSGVQGAYDRNENGVDGTVPQTVRCVGRLTAAQLMPGVVANAAWAATGGWGWLNNNDNTSSINAAVYQVDTSNAAGTGRFMENSVRIVNADN